MRAGACASASRATGATLAAPAGEGVIQAQRRTGEHCSGPHRDRGGEQQNCHLLTADPVSAEVEGPAMVRLFTILLTSRRARLQTGRLAATSAPADRTFTSRRTIRALMRFE